MLKVNTIISSVFACVYVIGSGMLVALLSTDASTVEHQIECWTGHWDLHPLYRGSCDQIDRVQTGQVCMDAFVVGT